MSLRQNFLDSARSGDLRLLEIFAAKLGHENFGKSTDVLGRTALHVAAKEGHDDVCLYLLNLLKFDVNEQDEYGETPLHFATLGDHLKTALLLLHFGADLSKTNTLGFAPIHYAALKGASNLLQLFISRGADIEVSSFQGTPLACAVQEGNKDAVQVLLLNKANPNAVLHDLAAPIHFSSKFSLEITDLLIKAGADPNAKVIGATPLHCAATTDNNEVISYLLSAGADPDLLDDIDSSGRLGSTPLECAAFFGSTKAVNVLFPVTKPTANISDWSIDGLMRYVNSEDAKEKIFQRVKLMLDKTKSKGDDALRRNDYGAALFWYGEAIRLDQRDAELFSNRSLCYVNLNLRTQALFDAQACVRLRPDWHMAHYMEGVAWKLLKNDEFALKSFSIALKLDPRNVESQVAHRMAMAAQRKQKFNTYSMVSWME